MESPVGFKPLQIGPWENLLKRIWDWFDAETIRNIITSFKIRSYEDQVDEGASVESEYEFVDSNEWTDDTLKLQKHFFDVVNRDGDVLQSARYMRDIMSAQRLHHDGQPLEEMVKHVIEQLKEARRQEEVRANELFVGRDRDMQLILGLLGVSSFSRSNLTKEDKQTIQQFSDRIKGVYVSGIGGQGKTALVKRICDDLLLSCEHWKTIMVSLRNKDGITQVIKSILAKVGVLCSGADRRELIQRLIEFMTSEQQNTLICLDDCDDIVREQLGGFLAEIFKQMGKAAIQCKSNHILYHFSSICLLLNDVNLSSPQDQFRFLLTSRPKLLAPEKERVLKRGNVEIKLGGWLADLELDGLIDDEAIELLRRYSQKGTGLEEDIAHSIVTCCSLSPLAITMAAQLLKQERFSPQQLLFHLKKDQRNVTKALAMDICIVESFQSFSEEVKAGLIRLAVFKSSKFDLKSAGKILCTDTPKDILQPLHDYHFLEAVRSSRRGEQSDTEYSLHPLVFKFVSEKLMMGKFRDTYSKAIVQFVDLIEAKIGRILKLCSTKCKKGMAELEENLVHITQFYDFMLDKKQLMKPYPKTVKSKFVLAKKKVSDLTDLVLSNAKTSRLFSSEMERAKQTGCDAMQIFWTVEEADVLLILHQKPELALEKLNQLPSGRFAALQNLCDQPVYPPLVMALFHKLKGQAFWKLLLYKEAMMHLNLSLHFFEYLRPVESYCFLKAKLLEYVGLVLFDMKDLDKCEETLQEAFDIIQGQIHVKDPNDKRSAQLKKQSLQIPRFFTHFGAIEIEKAHLEKDITKRDKHLYKALEYLCEGMELDKQLHMDNLDDFAAKMKLRADVYIEQGLLEEAEKFAEAAENQRRSCLQLPHLNVTESVYQLTKIYMLKAMADTKTRQHYLECAVDFFDELREDHIISGSIPTTRHPLYGKIKRDNLELYRIMGGERKIKETKQFYEDVENGKYDHIKKSFEEEFERMKFTTQEVLDQIFGGGGAQFGANENMMLQVGDSRVRHDSGRGDSSVEGSLSSVSEGGSITDSINRLHIQKSLSIEDDVFQMEGRHQKPPVKRQKTEPDD